MTDAAEEKSHKRRRIDGEKDTADPNAKGDELKGAGSPGLPHLPPDLWALVMPFMPYSDTLTCSILNKSFLNDVAPIIKQITVLNAEKMRAGKPASRFRGLEEVVIACLYRDPNGHKLTDSTKEKSYEHAIWDREVLNRTPPLVDDNVVSRVIPFLTSFSFLSYLDFGRFFLSPRWAEDGCSDYDLIFAKWSGKYDFCYILQNDESTMLRAIAKRNIDLMVDLDTAIGGAIAAGMIPHHAEVKGLFDSCIRNQGGQFTQSVCCEHCAFCYKNFPFKWVAKSLKKRCNHPGPIIEYFLKRKGGKEYLLSKEFVLDYNCMMYPYTKLGISRSLQKRGFAASVSREEFLESIEKLSDNDRKAIFGNSYHREALIAFGVPIRDSDWPNLPIDQAADYDS